MTATPKDLQDEVGRLRAALGECLICLAADLLTESISPGHIAPENLPKVQRAHDLALSALAQAPPESAVCECGKSRIGYCAVHNHGWINTPRADETGYKLRLPHGLKIDVDPSLGENEWYLKHPETQPQALVSCLSYQDDPTNRSILLADAPQACEHEWWTPDMGWTRCRICGAEYLGPQVSRRESQVCEHKGRTAGQNLPID